MAVHLLLDFSRPDVVRALRIVNDGVMGGVSVSRLGSVAGATVFEGHLSLENSGGSPRFAGPHNSPNGARRCC